MSSGAISDHTIRNFLAAPYSRIQSHGWWSAAKFIPVDINMPKVPTTAFYNVDYPSRSAVPVWMIANSNERSSFSHMVIWDISIRGDAGTSRLGSQKAASTFTKRILSGRKARDTFKGAVLIFERSEDGKEGLAFIGEALVECVNRCGDQGQGPADSYSHPGDDRKENLPDHDTTPAQSAPVTYKLVLKDGTKMKIQGDAVQCTINYSPQYSAASLKLRYVADLLLCKTSLHQDNYWGLHAEPQSFIHYNIDWEALTHGSLYGIPPKAYMVDEGTARGSSKGQLVEFSTMLVTPLCRYSYFKRSRDALVMAVEDNSDVSKLIISHPNFRSAGNEIVSPGCCPTGDWHLSNCSLKFLCPSQFETNDTKSTSTSNLEDQDAFLASGLVYSVNADVAATIHMPYLNARGEQECKISMRIKDPQYSTVGRRYTLSGTLLLSNFVGSPVPDTQIYDKHEKIPEKVKAENTFELHDHLETFFIFEFYQGQEFSDEGEAFTAQAYVLEEPEQIEVEEVDDIAKAIYGSSVRSTGHYPSKLLTTLQLLGGRGRKKSNEAPGYNDVSNTGG